MVALVAVALLLVVLGAAATTAAGVRLPLFGNMDLPRDDREAALRGEQPVTHGPFRVIPPGHPEAEVFTRPTRPPTAAEAARDAQERAAYERVSHQEAGAPLADPAGALADAKRLIPQMKVPTLPAGLALTGVEAARSSLPSRERGYWYVELTYADRARARGMSITESRKQEPDALIPILRDTSHPLQELVLGEVNGQP